MNNENNTNEYKPVRLQLSFKSLVKLSLMMGLFSSLLLIPLGIFVTTIGADSVSFIELLFVFVAPPLMGIFNGLLFGVLSYPLYSWFSNNLQGHLYHVRTYDSDK